MIDTTQSKSPKNNYLLLIIIVVVAVLMISAILVAGYRSYKSTEKVIIKQTRRENLILAKDSARGMAQFIDTIDDVLHMISNDPHIQKMDEAESRELLPRAYEELKIEGVINVGIIDSKGVFRYGVTDPTREGSNVAFRQFFKDTMAMKDDEYIAIEFIDFKGKFGGKKGAALAIPIFSDQTETEGPRKIVGVIHAVFDLDILTDAFLKSIQANHKHVMMIDSNGEILWWPDKSLKYKNAFDVSKGYPGFTGIIKSMLKGGTGTGSFNYRIYNDNRLKFEGGVEEYLIAYAPVDFGKKFWFVGVWEHKRDILAATRASFINLTTLVGAVILVVVFATGFALASILKTTAEVRKNEERFRHIAAVLQESFIKPVPDIPGMDVWVGYEAASEAEKVGGDFYDIFKISDDMLMILIGDVAGKGVKAAGFTETVRSSIRSFAQLDNSPAYILEHASGSFYSQIEGYSFVTAILCTLNIKTGELIIAGAGHPPPIHISEDPEYLDVAINLPIGAVKKEEYKENHYRLKPGDGLLLFTDGLSEARRGKEFFGLERILDIVKTHKNLKSKELVEKLLYAAAAFADGRLTDDVAVVAIKSINT